MNPLEQLKGVGDGTYLKYFLDSAFVSGDPSGFIVLFFMGMLRLLPIIAMTPFFGAKILPHPAKVAFGIMLYIILLPHIIATTNTEMQVNLTLLTHGLKEIFIGTLIGMVATIPFFIAETAGIYIDHQRGGSSLMIQDPHIQNQDSPLGIIWNYVLIILFYNLDGEFLFIEGLINSYTLVPIDGFFNPVFFTKESPFWQTVMTLLAVVMRLGVQIATPALIMILMTEVFLGIANRLAPNVQITFLGMPLKSLLGLGIVCFGWGYIISQLKYELMTWLYKVNELIWMFGVG